MPGLGSFVGEFEQAYVRAAGGEDALLSGQETVRYEIDAADGTLVGELQVLFSAAQTAQAIEFLAGAPHALAELELGAQTFLPADAAFADEPLREPEHLLRRYASVSLGELPELGALTTGGDGDQAAEPGTLTLEVTPTRWLLRPGDWSPALHNG